MPLFSDRLPSVMRLVASCLAVTSIAAAGTAGYVTWFLAFALGRYLGAH